MTYDVEQVLSQFSNEKRKNLAQNIIDGSPASYRDMLTSDKINAAKLRLEQAKNKLIPTFVYNTIFWRTAFTDASFAFTESLRRDRKQWLSDQRRSVLVDKQVPKIAAVLCSDSRISEKIFDIKIGDGFILKNVGATITTKDNVNVMSPESRGHMHYAAKFLGVEQYVVTSHRLCGCIANAASGGKPHDTGTITQETLDVLIDLALAKGHAKNAIEPMSITECRHYLERLGFDTSILQEKVIKLKAMEVYDVLHNRQLAIEEVKTTATNMSVEAVHIALYDHLNAYLYNPDTKKFVKLTDNARKSERTMELVTITQRQKVAA